jgi:hypothetical protein
MLFSASGYWRVTRPTLLHSFSRSRSAERGSGLAACRSRIAPVMETPVKKPKSGDRLAIVAAPIDTPASIMRLRWNPLECFAYSPRRRSRRVLSGITYRRNARVCAAERRWVRLIIAQ